MTNSDNTYSSPISFRTAIEQRLKDKAQKEDCDLMGLRRRLVFDRFLDRLFRQNKGSILLKGGYAMELRLPIARTTKDVDLTLLDKVLYSQEPAVQTQYMREILIRASRMDLNDYFEFEISGPVKTIDAAFGGARFTIRASMGGREFATFHVDMAIGDPLIKPIEHSRPEQLLNFAGVTTLEYPLISKEQHFAEKLHIYTRPDIKDNSRAKDLVDMILLIKNSLNHKKVNSAIEKTFAARGTHKLPAQLETPPESWKQPFAELARRCQITTDVREGFQFLNAFFNDHLASK